MSAYKKFAYDLRLDGKVAVVTGGTSGIGQETARMLAWKGATVIIFGRNPKIHEIAAQLGPKVTGINVDITQTTQIAAAVDQVIKMNGAIDILVNSAGIGSGTLTYAGGAGEVNTVTVTQLSSPTRCGCPTSHCGATGVLRPCTEPHPR